MPLSAYDASVALFVRGLRSVKTLLKKAEAHAAGNLDMNELATQIHWTAQGSRLAIARLLGDTSAAPAPAEGASFAELAARVDAAIAALEAVPRAAVEGAISRTVSLDHRGKSVTFAGDEYLVKFAIPNFYFHFSALYSLLRRSGVELTKGDFMGDVFG